MRKARTMAALLVLVVMSLASMAVAADEAVKGENGSDSNTLAMAVIFQGFASIGSAGYLVKRYMDKVDTGAEAIPKLTMTLEALGKTLTEHKTAVEKGLSELASNQKELYDSRNEHEKSLTEINALHRFKKCDTV